MKRASTNDSTQNPKVIRPHTSQTLPRARLFTVIHNALAISGFAWITSPGGAGKTTLVSSYIDSRELPCVWYQLDGGDADPASFFYYLTLAAGGVIPQHLSQLPALTPEYMSQLVLFARRYTEALREYLPAGTVIVLDNFQELVDSPVIGDVLSTMVEAMGAGLHLIVISRHYPGPSFARLRARRCLTVIDWADIRFTPGEWLEIGRLLGFNDRSPKPLLELHRKSDGWIASLILALSQEADCAWPETDTLSKELVFEYFAAEIFDRLDADFQSFLLYTAFVPHASISAAARLTGSTSAGEYLRVLSQRNFFIQRLTSEQYTYHPMFRHFLQEQAAKLLDSGAYRALLTASANQLLAEGQDDAAAWLLVRLGDWEALAELVPSIADELIEAGRFRLLRQLLNALPVERVSASPWLTYWLAVAHSVEDSTQTMGLYRQAYEAFLADGDGPGAYLTWYQANRLMCSTWRHTEQLRYWLDQYAELTERLPQRPDNLPWARMLAVLSLGFFFSGHAPRKADLFLEQLETEIATIDDPLLKSEVLSNYLFIRFVQGYGRQSKHYVSMLEATAAGLNLPPPLHLNVLVNRALAEGFAGSAERGLELAADGLALGARSAMDYLDGLLNFSGYTAAVLSGHYDQISRWRTDLARCAEEDPVLTTIYHYNNAWVELLERHTENALEHIRTAFYAIQRTGIYPYRIFIETLETSALVRQADWTEVDRRIHRLRPIVHVLRLVALDFQLRLLEARMADQLEQPYKTASLLIDAWEFARTVGIRRYPGMDLPVCSWAARQALAQGIETDFVREFVETGYELFDTPSAAHIHWPWPIRIYTLGRHEIIAKGEALIANSRREQKPLQLLRALVQFGGSATVDQVIDENYHDAAITNPLNTLHTHLHRLRKVLGDERAILWQGSTIAINPHLCWSDLSALEVVIDDNEHHGRNTDALVLELYRGEFLPASGESFHTVVTRENIRSRFVRYVLNRLDHGGLVPEQAIAFAQRALDVEPLSEEIYQRLITLYREIGEYESARAMGRRLERISRAQTGSPDETS